jgi:hypothetical protein
LCVWAVAFFAAVMGWGLACLALATRRWAWAVPAGLLLGAGVMMSYGMPLMALVAVAILVAGRSWRPLLPALASALAVVLAFAAAGFVWWDAYPVLRERYLDGIAQDRPQAYWWYADLAALVVCAGPLLLSGLACAAVTASSAARRGARVALLLSGSAVLVVALADASGMSKAEVERIWLPFVPWLTVSFALLPERWRRWGLGLQVLAALLVQHLFYTSW